MVEDLTRLKESTLVSWTEQIMKKRRGQSTLLVSFAKGQEAKERWHVIKGLRCVYRI